MKQRTSAYGKLETEMKELLSRQDKDERKVKEDQLAANTSEDHQERKSGGHISIRSFLDLGIFN